MVANEEIDLMITLWPPAWKKGFTNTRGVTMKPSQTGLDIAKKKDTQPPQTTAAKTQVGHDK